MAHYLERHCPRCNDYVGIRMREPDRNTRVQAVNGHCLACGYRLSWLLIQGRNPAKLTTSWHVGYALLVKKTPKYLRGSTLTAAVAEKFFGWKNVRKLNGELTGRKQDTVGRWRSAKVPSYSTDPAHGYAIVERMKQLGISAQYLKELAKITNANKMPLDQATPEQRSRAAIKVLHRKTRNVIR